MKVLAGFWGQNTDYWLHLDDFSVLQKVQQRIAGAETSPRIATLGTGPCPLTRRENGLAFCVRTVLLHHLVVNTKEEEGATH